MLRYYRQVIRLTGGEYAHTLHNALQHYLADLCGFRQVATFNLNSNHVAF